MKIGFVLDDSLDKNDGVQQYVLTLGKWLSKNGHEVHYLTGTTKRKDIPNIHSLSKNITVRFNKNRMTIPIYANSSKIRQLMQGERFDVLHVQMPYSPILAGKIINNAWKNTAIVGTFHILPFSRLQATAAKILAVATRRTNKKFNAVISVSSPAKEFSEKVFNIKSKIIPNAVDIKSLRKFGNSKKIASKRIKIVFLGRLVERKGCLQFLKAIDQLSKQGALNGVSVVVAGSGPQEGKLRQFITKNKLDNAVKMLGYISENDKPSLLNSADIAVFPSLGGESFGIVLIEAMASGSDVVIAGDNPGYRSIMDGRSLQLVNPYEVKSMTRIITNYLNSAAERKKAKKWQQTRVAKFDVEKIGRKIIRTYEHALLQAEKMR